MQAIHCDKLSAEQWLSLQCVPWVPAVQTVYLSRRRRTTAAAQQRIARGARLRAALQPAAKPIPRVASKSPDPTLDRWSRAFTK